MPSTESCALSVAQSELHLTSSSLGVGAENALKGATNALKEYERGPQRGVVREFLADLFYV